MSVRRSPVASHRDAPDLPSGRLPRKQRWSWRRSLTGFLAAAGIWQCPVSTWAQEAAIAPAPATTNSEYTLPTEDASGSASFPRLTFPQLNYPLYPNEPPVVGGFGAKARIAAQAGTTVGQSQPLTAFDLSPYLFEGNLYLFGEGRIALGNDGKTGGSLGAGARYFIPQMNSILGASGWLDIDATRGPTFHQWGINAEFLSEFLDIRGNVYTPYGSINQVISQRFEAGSQKFIDRPLVDVLPGESQGTYLSFQRRIFSATALQGFDTLFSIPMPGDFAQSLNLETSAGFYGYEAKDGSVAQTYGWRLRFDIDLFEHLSHMFLEVNNDKTFKTNVAFVADINYWHKLEHRPRLGHSQYNRLAEWVRRNRTVVALESSALAAPELAINPTTGNPYVIYQVLQTDEVSHGGDGTLGNPFQNLQDAIDATGTGTATRPSDFIQFVQGNSVIQDGITLNAGLDGMRVIGEQSTPTVGIPVSGLGSSVLLPTITPVPFNTPTIQNVTGVNAVTIAANNTTFAAMDILNTTGGDAIHYNTGISGGTIQSVNITTVNAGNGLSMNSNAGTFSFSDLLITDIEGNAVDIQGGTASVQFSGTSQINNTTNSHPAHGYAVNVVDTLAGSTVNMQNVAISDTGGKGIRIYGTNPGSSFANVSFGAVTLTDTVVPAASGTEISNGAVYIRNHSGSVSFLDTLNINGIDSVLGGDSFVVEGLQATNAASVFLQGATNITNRRGRGIYVVDSADAGTATASTNLVQFGGAVNITGLGTGYTGDDPAVLMQSYSGGLNFNNSLSISGSLGDGIEVTKGTGAIAAGTNVGLFQAANVSITGVSGAGGTTGTSFNVHDLDKSSFTIRTVGLAINNRGAAASTGAIGKGINVTDFQGLASFLGTTVVNNQLASEAIAVDIETNNALGSVGFNSLTVNDQVGVGSYGVRVTNNLNSTAGVSFGQVNVTSTDATAVSIEDNALVTVGSGTINATDARGIEVFTNPAFATTQNHSISLTSVSATNSDYGIYVDDSQGQFTVTGTSGAGGSGGTITTMTNAGAHFSNTQRASLNNMIFTNNLRGVEADTMVIATGVQSPLMLINNTSISGSAGEGIFARNINNFTLSNSTISSNGVALGQEQIELFIANTIGVTNNSNGTVTAIFNNNNIVDSLTTAITGTDMIYIHNAASSSSPLNLTFTNNGAPASTSNLNSITSNRGTGDAAIAVNWSNSATTATFNTNQINTLNTAGQIGLNLATNGATTINYLNNALNASGNNAVGIQGVFQQATTFNASGNQVFDANGNLVSGSGFLFSGSFATGMNLQFLAAGNTITVNNNLFEFTQIGSQGIVFQRLTGNGNTNVAIGGNSIYRPASNNTITNPPTVGIYIQTVLGNINLINSGDNFVEFGSVPGLAYYDFLMTSPGAANGSQISVNGSLVP